MAYQAVAKWMREYYPTTLVIAFMFGPLAYCGYVVENSIERARQEQERQDLQREADRQAALKARGDAPWENCDEARAYGETPVYEDDPRFGDWLDRDGDGVGCERRP